MSRTKSAHAPPPCRATPTARSSLAIVAVAPETAMIPNRSCRSNIAVKQEPSSMKAARTARPGNSTATSWGSSGPARRLPTETAATNRPPMKAESVIAVPSTRSACAVVSAACTRTTPKPHAVASPTMSIIARANAYWPYGVGPNIRAKTMLAANPANPWTPVAAMSQNAPRDERRAIADAEADGSSTGLLAVPCGEADLSMFTSSFRLPGTPYGSIAKDRMRQRLVRSYGARYGVSVLLYMGWQRQNAHDSTPWSTHRYTL